MPTAVVQLHVDRIPDRVTVAAAYTRALIVLRRNNQPVARFELPVSAGVVDRRALGQALFETIWRLCPSWWLEEYLGDEPPSATPEATVAICTRERPDDLRRALTAIRVLDPRPREVIVIDNDPASGATRDVVSEFADVRYIWHRQRGLDRARNRALQEARTGIVAFTDDDAAPEPGWLGALLQAFSEPRVWCATGLTLPLELETPAQEWFERYAPFSRGFKRRVFDGTTVDPLAVSPVGAGANMALRTSVLTDLGGFDEALDAGTPTRSGGDHEMFGRILGAGYRIVYEPAAMSWHRHRRSWPELRDALRGYGSGVYAMWTRRLLREHDPGVMRHAFAWLRHDQLPELWRAVRRRPNAVPLDLVCAELAGCLAGPVAYARSRAQQRRSVPA